MDPLFPAVPAEAEAGGVAPLNAARPAPERAALLEWVCVKLRAEYGEQALVSRRDPMHELISTVLSQRTTHADEEAAYQELRELGDWDAIIAAPTGAVAHAIRRSNYPESKAPRIQETLRRIRDAPGGYDLNFLRDLPVPEALKWLTALPGVGIKTASLVLLFNYARPVFPVDTHVHRVSSRVGVIPRMGEQAAHRALLALLPPDPPLLYDLHINFLSHGRKVCTWNRPRCAACVLRSRCDAYATYSDHVPSFSEKK